MSQSRSVAESAGITWWRHEIASRGGGEGEVLAYQSGLGVLEISNRRVESGNFPLELVRGLGSVLRGRVLVPSQVLLESADSVLSLGQLLLRRESEGNASVLARQSSTASKEEGSEAGVSLPRSFP